MDVGQWVLLAGVYLILSEQAEVLGKSKTPARVLILACLAMAFLTAAEII